MRSLGFVRAQVRRNVMLMPRFVLLRHETPPDYGRASHWDLMFETGDVLRTWAIEELPTPGKAIAAEPLADHRLAYLDYEGPVSGNRGEVRREDAGDYEMVEDEAERFVVLLHGQHLQGRFELQRQGVRCWRMAAVSLNDR